MHGRNEYDPLAPKTGWSSHGVLQQQNTTGQFTMQVKFPVAGPYTVQFAIDAATGQQALAIITWTCEGNPIVREVTVAQNGTSVSGVGQAVQVRMIDASFARLGPGQTPPTYNVSVSVAPGTRPTTSTGPVLIPNNPVVGGPTGGQFTLVGPSTLSIPIPPNSGVTSVYITAGSDPPAIFTEADLDVQQTEGGLPLKQYDPREMGYVPISPGADAINLRNFSGTTIIFGVAFGVDG